MGSSKSLIDVKTKLAEKYERLANITRSTPKAKSYRFHAVKFRRQIAQLQRPGKGK